MLYVRPILDYWMAKRDYRRFRRFGGRSEQIKAQVLGKAAAGLGYGSLADMGSAVLRHGAAAEGRTERYSADGEK